MTTQTFLNTFKAIETVTTQLVKMIVSIFTFSIGEIAPLAAPVAPAFSVFKALSERLETPFAIALAGAIAIELVGIFISKTAIHCHNWNSTRIKSEPEAPKKLTVALAAIFFSVVFILSLTIEIDPDLAILVYPSFVAIAVCTYTSLAVSNNLQAWERHRAERLALAAEKRGLTSEIKAAKTEAADLAATIETLTAERAKLAADIDRKAAQLARLNNQNRGQSDEHPATKNHFGPENLAKANRVKKANIKDRRQQVLTLKRDGLTHREIAERLDVSLGTIKNDVKALNGQLQGVS